MLTTRATETDVARLCDELAATLGYRVERYEQRRASRICEGLPDRRYVRGNRRVWVELKRPGGKLTEAQHHWLVSELAAGGVATVIDDVPQLATVFRALARSDYMAQQNAVVYCRDLLDLVARRGWR